MFLLKYKNFRGGPADRTPGVAFWDLGVNSLTGTTFADLTSFYTTEGEAAEGALVIERIAHVDYRTPVFVVQLKADTIIQKRATLSARSKLDPISFIDEHSQQHRHLPRQYWR